MYSNFFIIVISQMGECFNPAQHRARCLGTFCIMWIVDYLLSWKIAYYDVSKTFHPSFIYPNSVPFFFFCHLSALYSGSSSSYLYLKMRMHGKLWFLLHLWLIKQSYSCIFPQIFKFLERYVKLSHSSDASKSACIEWKS